MSETIPHHISRGKGDRPISSRGRARAHLHFFFSPQKKLPLPVAGDGGGSRPQPILAPLSDAKPRQRSNAGEKARSTPSTGHFFATFTRHGFITSTAAAASAAGLKPGRITQANYPARPITMICRGRRAVAPSDRAHPRRPHRAGLRPAGQRRGPHRRLGRRRPFGDRDGGARRLHAQHHHGRDLDDALARPHQLTPRSYTPLALINDDPPASGARRPPYKTVEELAAAIKAAPPASSRPPAPARAASGTSPLSAGSAMGVTRPCRLGPSNGAAPAIRILPPAASNRHLLGAGGARHDRGRQGEEPRPDGGGEEPSLQTVPT